MEGGWHTGEMGRRACSPFCVLLLLLGRTYPCLAFLALGCPTGLRAPLPVGTRSPSVQGPTSDSGQRRQPPLADRQPRGEQQAPRASWSAASWVPGTRPAVAAVLALRPGAGFQQ